ncbi:hypothetical protein [Labrys neptuniae]
MRIPILLACLALLAGTAASHAAPRPHCADAAVKQAAKLLAFHSDNDDRAQVDPDSVRAIGTVGALVGKGRFDVIEVEGSIYKGNYRMHLIYAQLPGDCVLMGQEILERSDPY